MGASSTGCWRCRRYDNINLRILPLDAPHPIITGGFILLQFDRAHDVGYHDMAYIEHLIGSLYFEAEKDTYKYQLLSAAVRFSLKPRIPPADLGPGGTGGDVPRPSAS